MIKHLAKLEHLAWSIQTTTEANLNHANRMTTEGPFERGYQAGQSVSTQSIINQATELHQLIKEIKAEYEKEVYLEDDVDLSGMEVREHA